ncbi:class F sortase [Modestobacter sp. I12A-02628]|uniref:Class F sortase n=1 Tax=Goekera deserti TaxID=2497753 RepID=A0A7K3W9B6_9ACTN|nr:class F sortase [Goekera deserti]NDI50113.1 class F sortase [Goekera deserti]NEL52410.1 class F sortase [Goekera deserti]
MLAPLLATVAVTATVLAVLVGAPSTVRQSGSVQALTTPDAQPAVLGSSPATGGPAPVAVSMPTIGVQGSLVPLGTDASGVLVPPTDFAQAGWFSEGTVPGDVGPAVIAGHVDSRAGPAVFYRLEELAPGDRLTVTRTDGSVLTFQVTRVGQYPKAEFPTEEVYGPVGAPELRLITCGGVFDHTRRSYVDNVVVFARLV